MMVGHTGCRCGLSWTPQPDWVREGGGNEVLRGYPQSRWAEQTVEGSTKQVRGSRHHCRCPKAATGDARTLDQRRLLRQAMRPHGFGTYQAPHNRHPRRLTVPTRRVGKHGYPGSEFRLAPEAGLADSRVARRCLLHPQGGNLSSSRERRVYPRGICSAARVGDDDGEANGDAVPRPGERWPFAA
jgi:hypothetical protein